MRPPALLLIAVTLTPLYSANAARIGSDKALARLQKRLPRGWVMKQTPGRLIIESRAFVWVLHQNMINAPATTLSPASHTARIKKQGRKMHSAIIFKTAPRWSSTKMAKARAKNRLIRKKIAALITKYGLSSLFRSNSKLSIEARARRKGLSGVYARYIRKKSALERSLVRLPEYQSSRSSLWILSTPGASDQFSLVHPYAISRQNYAIRSLLPSILTPVKK
mgnify:CR=1 FL=1